MTFFSIFFSSTVLVIPIGLNQFGRISLVIILALFWSCLIHFGLILFYLISHWLARRSMAESLVRVSKEMLDEVSLDHTRWRIALIWYLCVFWWYCGDPLIINKGIACVSRTTLADGIVICCSAVGVPSKKPGKGVATLLAYTCQVFVLVWFFGWFILVWTLLVEPAWVLQLWFVLFNSILLRLTRFGLDHFGLISPWSAVFVAGGAGKSKHPPNSPLDLVDSRKVVILWCLMFVDCEEIVLENLLWMS